ncbi:MAG: plasmid mobilization relaxosome protein MobC [Arcobacteraceae bacterium]
MKTEVINFRVSEEVRKMLDFKSNAADKTKTQFLIDLIILNEVKFDESSNIIQLIFQLRKIGNNVNQIAHALNLANMNNDLSDFNYKNLLNQLVLIEHRLNQLLKAKSIRND